MIVRSLQFIFILLLLSLPASGAENELVAGSTHRLVFRDVDGNDLSTTEGRVTIITVVTRENEEKARAVADLVPDQYVGHPSYRYVTLVNFQRKLAGPLHGLTRMVIRQRLDAEAKELKPKYEARKLNRDPRGDMYVIADFDGSAVEQLGLSAEASVVAVFVFDGAGKLTARWDGVPPKDGFVKAIAAAG